MTDDRKPDSRITEGYRLVERITGVRCAKCSEFIWSIQRHDFHCCSCGYTFVDGGRDYLRFGSGTKEEAKKKITPQLPSIETYDVLVNTKTGELTLLPVEKKEKG